MQTGYTDGAIDIGRQMGGQFTAEEIVRNFYGLRKIKTVDETGNVTDIDDELRDERSLRKAGVYDYYLLHKEALERYGVSEETILRLFPYVQFNKKAVTTASETPSEWGLSDVSGTSDEGGETTGPKSTTKRRRNSTASTKA